MYRVWEKSERTDNQWEKTWFTAKYKSEAQDYVHDMYMANEADRMVGCYDPTLQYKIKEEVAVC